ncbi:uncharacterized protein LOC127287402 [Leptopilina boulardi]|uniref:uncharacterized protein LOC127287402 n=1 Tax=Leptopilina boulardi TaxID=63433 RepID=UPI0021F607B3|nr:uncharacterized protein LOC127287402 [Leptopilina boulardi]
MRRDVQLSCSKFLDRRSSIAQNSHFCPSEGEHAGRDIAAVFYKAINEFNIKEKILGITVDNASSNTTFMWELTFLMDFDHENQHFRCYAHIINLAVQDLLKELKLKASNEIENELEEEDDSRENERTNENTETRENFDNSLKNRHKVEQFRKTSWGKEMETYSISKFEEIYRTKYYESSETKENTEIEETLEANAESNEDEDILDLDSFYENQIRNPKTKTNRNQWKHEINMYLAEKRAEKDVDILEWWKMHEKSFKSLAKMARDYLAIQATSVQSERVFSKKQDITKAAKSLKATFVSGPDNIPSFIVKDCASVLAEPLTLIFNLALKSRIFPHVWKEAKIIPVYKVGEKSRVTNYRPIALLQNFAKVFERAILNSILLPLMNIIIDEQHGCVRNRFILTNLLTFTQIVNTALQRGLQVDVAYLDFSKAFDTIDHQILARKMVTKLAILPGYVLTLSFYGKLLQTLETVSQYESAVNLL